MSARHAKAAFAALSLLLAVSTGIARCEKIWAQNHLDAPPAPIHAETVHEGHEPYDPRRVPSSGGAASRLLAGISVKHA
jgi:hypothetical protein